MADLIPSNGARLFRAFNFGPIRAEYWQDSHTGAVGLLLKPAAQGATPGRGCHLDSAEIALDGAAIDRLRARQVEHLVQIKVTGSAYSGGFAQGRTLRNGATVEALVLDRQEVLEEPLGIAVTTWLRHPAGWRVGHQLLFRPAATWLECGCYVENGTSEPLTLEALSSFSLSGITPYAEDDAPGRLKLHRFRNVWSAEGRLESRPFEELQLERSWAGYGVRCERFGVTGSLPCNGYCPVAAIEDSGAGVTWAAALASPGTWQMEVYRRDDHASFSGGLGDRESGHWLKTLNPGDSFATPSAYVTCTAGGVDDACAALLGAHQRQVVSQPQYEEDLPVIFNEWCTTWGRPTHDNLAALAKALKPTGVRYLVIDAGWYAPAEGSWNDSQGDWVPSEKLFPHGLAASAAAIRGEGLIPGIWFEMETAGPNSRLYHRLDWLLHRDGAPLTAGVRRFLDLRKPQVAAYLADRVIGTLKNSGFGYLKVDYNETIGIGADGAESLGEALRQHLAAVQDFFKRLREELPGLVIENCSSGGHRIEPSFLALTAMSSFSDAHECQEIPIIAANLNRLCLPRQSQIWAVLRAEDSPQRMIYSLAAGFLGRLCLSGDYLKLTLPQIDLVKRVVGLYQRAAAVIKSGRSYRHGPPVSAYRHAQGWQAVVRLGSDGQEILIVVHVFAKPDISSIVLALPEGGWDIAAGLWSDSNRPSVSGNHFEWRFGQEWSGLVAVLNRRSREDRV